MNHGLLGSKRAHRLALLVLLVLLATTSSACESDVAQPIEAPPAESLGAAGQAITTCVTLGRGGPGVSDAWISATHPATNHGSTTTLASGGVAPESSRALVRFDLSSIPAGAALVSAGLSLQTQKTTGAATVRAHRITSPWAAAAVTWASFGDAFDIAVAASASNASPTVSFDITALAGGWLADPTSNNGVLLEQDPGALTLFKSNEFSAPAQRPGLFICYKPPTCNDGSQNQGETGVDCGGPCPACDLCKGVACAAPDSCHQPGKCDSATGACVYPPLPDGTPCDDGNACTPTDTCESGACLGSNTLATILDGHAEAPYGGDIDGDGVASLTLDAKAGSICFTLDWHHIAPPSAAHVTSGPPDDPDAAVEVTLSGGGKVAKTGCVKASPALIADLRKSPRHHFIRIDSAELPGGALFGQLDRFLPCAPADGCHQPGICEPSTGVCAPLDAVNGIPCDDGDPDTTGEACASGLCQVAPQSPQLPWPDVENSYLLPNKGTIYVALVFATCSLVTNPGCGYNFPSGPAPAGAATWFDTGPSAVLQGYLTNIYAQASFDEYMVYGDYWPTVIALPCTGSAVTDTQAVINIVNASPWATANGLPMALFDQWTPTSVGMPKINAPNGKLDAVNVVWANHAAFGCAGSGYGMQALVNSVDAVASYADGPLGYGFFQQEYFHGLFGGNNWHDGGGLAQHTFLAIPRTHSMCGQSAATSKMANAWDRQQMGWKPPGRASAIMAGDATCASDVPSDIDITTHPNGATFCLRDYNLAGDAVRIKLPHLDWDQIKPGQNKLAKNQYLVLENHRLEQSALPPRYTYNADIIGSPTNPSTPGYLACMAPSAPGLYPFIQVGKDVKTAPTPGALYSPPADQPNGLGSWTFSLQAEGNWDYVFRSDLVVPGAGVACNWGNPSLPAQGWAPETMPNPFTGLSELGLVFDTNGDGALYSGDNLYLGLSEVNRNGSTQNSWMEHGDGNDSYRPGYRTRIGLDTNPAATPLYTYTINPYNLSGGSLMSYENRAVYLNGLSVEILNQLPSGEMIVKVSWDDTQIDNDTRWTGNVILENDPDDPLLRPSTIDLQQCRTIDLDQGRSPTKHLGTPQPGGALFADPSVMVLAAGTTTTVGDQAKLMVRNGSTLYVRSGANLVIQGAGSVIVDGTSFLCVESGATIDLQGAGSTLVMNAGATAGFNPALNLPPMACQPLASIATTGPGVSVPASGCVPPPLPSGSTLASWPFEDLFWTQPELVHSNTLFKVGNPPACAGIIGNALCLDGLTTYGWSNDDPFLNVGAGDFSLDGWIRSLDATGVRVILDKREEGATVLGYSLFLSNGKLGFQMANGVGSSACSTSAISSCTNYVSTPVIADGLWHHVAVTVTRSSPTGGTFYVDGCAVTSFNPTFRPGDLTNISELTFGRRSSLSTGFFAGAVDEFHLYNRALTQGEIQSLSGAVGSGMCNGPF